MCIPFVQGQAGNIMNTLGMGRYVNHTTVVLFIPQQGILPGSLQEQSPLGHSMPRKEALHRGFSGPIVSKGVQALHSLMITSHHLPSAIRK
jgi:hypothetical protein